MRLQSKKRKRKLPKGITKRPGREVIELIFGKRIKRELDKITDPPSRSSVGS